ncbi:hypothetical protein CISG_06197 [Coccidioides immitis RMSCC 3703]|uniref:Uncharacterized protein n=2 Tax=Coccidioides immitis TaxID=5501 RepID=A0A0J8QYP7_COCIT|nr:hypothetical protein CIRG_10019 [Coccidioides immitis RMSCC 2394]KMU77160.1 hypothetical protein CISG_06197 [Coccidioides immitis RMSCC 3703]
MDGYYDDEEAINAALVASLNDSIKPHSKYLAMERDVVDLTGDPEGNSPNDAVEDSVSSVDDPDLRRAIALSLQDQALVLSPPQRHHAREVQRENHVISEDNKGSSPSSKEHSSGAFSLRGMDRKKQEEERLARLAKKRKAEDVSSADSPARQAKAVKSAPIDLTEESNQQNHAKAVATASKPLASNTPDPSLQFPNGAIKKTWAFNYPREDDIKFEEVVQKDDLELAVLSSFQWNMDWLFTKFNVKKTRFLLVMGHKYEEELLFLIDLPRKILGSQEKTSTPFFDELVYFLKASALHEKIIAKLSEFDFGKTAGFAFVHTIGGSHTGSYWGKTGVCGLGKAVTMLGLQTPQPLKLDYITSSLGSLNDQFMRSMYLAAQGDNGLKELTLRTSKTFPSDKWGVTVKKADGAEWKDRFLIYFPSLKTVQGSRARPSGAGTICFQSKWYNRAEFPRHTLRDSLSRRHGILMHSKTIFVRPDNGKIIGDANTTAYQGWTYVGSANLSESAWGRLVIDRSTTKPKLNCRNWECGVIIPIRDGKPSTTEEDVRESSDDDIDRIFGGIVPVPMKVPAPKYGPGNGPWFYLEDFQVE